MRPNNTKHFLTGKNLFTAPFTFLYSYFLLLSLFTFSFLLFNSCNTTEPGSSPQITLDFEDASSTEVWLNLHAGVDLPADVKIYKDNKLSRTINLISKDTVIYEDNLLPQKSYTFRASAKLGDIELQSQNVTAVTMDTTSHSFIAETFTFGEHSSSRLFDVSIIDENNIWAVGEIHTAETDKFDSNGVWVNPYNAVHWDGLKWELKRIYFYTFCNQTAKAPYPARSVFSFNDSLVVITSGSQITYVEHGIQKNIECIPVSVNSIWGTSSSDFYVVGNGGNIAHYNGSPSTDGWTKIENGTELKFHDIYGKNEKIYCVAAQLFSGINSELYEIKNNNTLLIDNTNLGLSSVSVYVLREKLYVFGYYRLVRTEGKIGWEQISEPVNFDGYAKIRGNGYNDVVAVGSFGKIYHYNGISWKLRRIGEDINNLIDFSSVAIKNNIICAVGKTKNFATIVIGRR